MQPFFQTPISSPLFIAISLAVVAPVSAHFQMVIPADEIVSQTEPRKLNIEAMFWHPFEGLGMNMAKPVKLGVVTPSKQQDLLAQATPTQRKDVTGQSFATWSINYALKQPGDHIFYVEPQPYWEPSEETFIVHYSKVIVNAFGLQTGWDKELGLKTEIVPLTRPYGAWAGNVFQGIVKLRGKPVPYANVEIEFYNSNAAIKAPAEPLITQVIKSDANGVFTYAMPKAGWWAFAALTEDNVKIKHEGKEYPVELGAVLMIKTYDMK